MIGPGGKGLKRDEVEDDNSDQSDDEESDGGSDGLSGFSDLSGSDEGSGGADESEEAENRYDDDESDTASNEERESDGAISAQAKTSIDEPMSPVADEARAAGDGKANGKEEEADGQTRYIPPQVRAAQLAATAANDTEKSQARTLLIRRLQGLLNRSVSIILERLESF